MPNTPFLWGTATSSFQIEGAWNTDGKGLSIWDEFCKQQGKISDGTNGNVACDHYNRLEEDVQLMQTLGMQAYRFSIAWPRIMPSGKGKVESRGLDFYDRMVDSLLQKGIQPFPTLYHWDLPLELHWLGGWLNPAICDWFAEYAQVVAARLGDRITHWTTFNEPHVFTFLGYQLGFHAPGHTSRTEYLRAMKHVLLSHAKADKAIRAALPRVKIGIANSHLCVEAKSEEFQHAADFIDQLTSHAWLQPFQHGTLPNAVQHLWAQHGIDISSSELQSLHCPLDFAGANYYMRMLASTTPDPLRPFMLEHPSYPNVQLTDIGWEVYPQGLAKVLQVYKNQYGNLPTYITENGACYNQGLNNEGIIDDQQRIDYLQSHLQSLESARHAGCNVKGYFAWSLMDNFEWAHGYSKRFGLVHIDYAQNAKRTPKQSAWWYKEYIERGNKK